MRVYQKTKALIYDGEKTYDMSLEEANKIEHSNDSKFMFIPRKTIEIETMKKDYDDFVFVADTLKKQSKGKINLYRTPNFKQASLKLWSYFIRPLDIQFEPMSQDEAEWHENCYCSGLILNFAEGETFETLHKFDVCSMYIWLMNSNLTIPIKRGEFMIADDEIKSRKYLPKGIYRATVGKGSKLFHYNEAGYYTNSELNKARNILGLDVTLIEDGKPNMLEYSEDKCIKLKTLFDKFIDLVFPMKQNATDKRVKDAIKAIITILWGALAQINKQKHNRKEQDEAVEFEFEDDDEYLVMIKPISKEIFQIETRKHLDLYIGVIPRIKAFITSYCREHMYSLLRDHLSSVKMILTDGFVMDTLAFKQIKKQGAELGSLVYEGVYRNITIRKTNTSYKSTETFVEYK